MLPVIRLGPAVIQTSLLALVAAIWIGAMVAARNAKKQGFPASGDVVWDFIGIGAAGTLVAARVIFVAQNFSAYAGDPIQMLSPAPGTLAMGYGAIFGAIAALAYAQRKKIPLALLLDGIAPGALAAAAIFSLGQFLSGDAYGTTTNLPWAIAIWGELRHPVQLYDCLGALIGWVGLTRVRTARAGMIALYAGVWSGAARLIVDAYRAEATLLPNGIRESQVIALVVVLGGLWMIGKSTMEDEGRMTVNQSPSSIIGGPSEDRNA